MTSSIAAAPPLVSLRRAKPLLGTLVDIRVDALAAEQAQRAIDAAFAEIRAVHRLMSLHDSSSDLARLNRARPGATIAVDPRTKAVLQAAETFRIESEGAFDAGVADALVALGLLPAMPANEAMTGETAPAGAGRVDVVRGRARLDLGGIAKGYAVDRAIAVLRQHGVVAALVDAGGDMRHFGARSAHILLRDPADPGRLSTPIELRNAALASSATSGLDQRGATAAMPPSALVDARQQQPLAPGAGASVIAASCMTADALTKVVLVSGDRAHPMLKKHDAALVLYRPANGDR